MQNQYERTERLFGPEGMEKLFHARVAVFGIGGVGGYAVEALARSGIGTLDLVDDDRVSLSNLNRQLHATHATLGQYKVDAAEARIREIDPRIIVHKHRTFLTPETASLFDFSEFDYVVDAIDTVTGKLTLIQAAYAAGTPVVSSMGAGNKLDPTALEAADIYETSVCPLARVMRKELKRRGIPALRVVYSRELPRTPLPESDAPGAEPGPLRPGKPKQQTPGSNAFVPAAAGLILAGEVVRAIAEKP